MKKEFVPYEQAVALKELGFDEICIATYDEDEYFDFLDFEQSYYTIPSKLIQAPLYQQAFRWFRDKHDLVHRIDKDGGWWVCAILELYDEKEQGTIEIYLENCYPNTYEEAELECLNKLISLIKNNNK
jgi:hypothetical protein